MAIKATGQADAAPTLSQYINLANYVYTSGRDISTFPTQTGYQALSYNGKLEADLDSLTGFYGQAFVNLSGPQAKIIIAFEGTNLKHNPPNGFFRDAQVRDDLDIFEGRTAPSFKTALNFTNTVIKDAAAEGIPLDDIFLDGHSLGGAEVEYVAAKTGLAGTTFGAPGISSANFSKGVTSRLTNYVEYGDPVGNYSADQPKALGTIVQRGNIKHYGGEVYTGPTDHRNLLTDAANEYALPNHEGRRDAEQDFLYGFENYHPLTNYANDLPDAQLYNDDNSTGSDADFFGPLFPSVGAVEAPCFTSGTRIDTARGPVVVEELSMDDQVVTASGARRPIRWIGHRAIDCQHHPRPRDVMPVRVAAHAFGAGMPGRDLYLSPGHPVLVGADQDAAGGYLVPIMCLINGTTIARFAVDEVTYWHVEVDGHDILLAEGLPAESYLDLGSRPWFDGGDGPLHDPDMVLPGMPGRCRPVAIDGPAVEAERRRLDAVFALRLVSACAWPDVEGMSPLP